MSIVRCKPLIHQWPMSWKPSLSPRDQQRARFLLPSPKNPFQATPNGYGLNTRLRSDSYHSLLRPIVEAKAAAQSPPLAETDLIFSETFDIERIKTTEGKVSVKLEPVAGNTYRWRLVIGCNLKGKWVLHWGVTYSDDLGCEWDQPPPEMRPPGSVQIKDYAVETPLSEISSSSEGQMSSVVQIEINGDTPIVAVNFVLKEEEMGAWFQHKGRDFRIPLRGDSLLEANSFNGKPGFGIWPGPPFEQISSMLLKSEEPEKETIPDPNPAPKPITEYQDQYTVLKQETVRNYLTVRVRKIEQNDQNALEFDTDIPDQVIVHWGVSLNNESRNNWEVPSPPYPNNTKILRKNALQTLLEPKSDGSGNKGSFILNKEIQALLFVLKLDEHTWIRNNNQDFYIPLTNPEKPETPQENQVENQEEKPETSYSETIITGIRTLVSNITSQKSKEEKTKEDQDSILQEIEKLVAEAYNIFRSSPVTYIEKIEEIEKTEQVKEKETGTDDSKPRVLVVQSGTGTGHEILCQGFNWESHKSGKWYIELGDKAKYLAELGFSIVWLPPPTESVSPEGYMPKDLYNLNSRYGSMEELKEIIKKFHQVGIKVLGDVVLNHRCASCQNQNGIWNIFGGRLNWDERAIVADDPHFQGRGNKSSGDNFHAAPNIDHSQDFVRNDLKEWLNWLRNEVGYDGWRLDFVRGFWGGYVKDYLESSSPYFAVGEYWDSLSYTYNEMDYNQDAHRQRIVDWINATSGKAGAFDVTTKGILHTALGKCEYWRLRDEKGKPPGVVGWWPSRAVTFIENHDTGSTQGHWRFPSGKEMQGYAYILTHPGTPAVFFDHIFSHYKHEMERLISLRRKNNIHCRSIVKITKAERDVYAAEIDEKLAMKIGPGHYEPENDSKKWSIVAEGNDYKVWEAS